MPLAQTFLSYNAIGPNILSYYVIGPNIPEL